MPAFDLRDNEDLGSYITTGATDTQQRESAHNMLMGTTQPITEPEIPINRLADVLANLQNQPQSTTIGPVTTTEGK